MRYVKWIFVVLLISSLTSFMSEGSIEGLNVGDMAPNFVIQSLHDKKLSDYKGKRVLLSFWASYDAPSRMRNVALCNEFQKADSQNFEMISISFDEYESVFKETRRKDCIATSVCFVETEGELSDLYKSYYLNQGFTNYLLDENGIILAKNISADELSTYLN